MSGTFLERCLSLVGQRLRKLRVLRRQALCWVMLMVPAIVVVLMIPATNEPSLISSEFIVLVGTTLVGLLIARSITNVPSRLETAQLIEKSCPELDDAVVTAVRVDEDYKTRHSVMSGMVIQRADRLARQSNWRSVVPGRKLFGWSLLSMLSFCFLISGVLAAGRWGRDISVADRKQPAGETEAETIAIGSSELVVEPGDVEIERGSALTIVARFSKTLPAAVGFEFIPETDADPATDSAAEPSESGPQLIQLMMDQTVDEGVFAARLGSVTSDGSYRVIFVDEPSDPLDASTARRNVTPSYRVKTFVRPRLEQLDAEITPPEYTGRGAKIIEDTLRLVAVEGSAIRFLAHLNKPVAVARLMAKDDTVIELTPDALDTQLFVADIVAEQDTTFQLYLEDFDGRTAAEEEQIIVRVTRNKPAKIKVTFPGRDTNVSPLQEFHVEAEASDDFAVIDYGIVYSLSGADPVTVSLRSEAGSENHQSSVKMKHMIALEDLDAQPDDLLTYYFYADTHDSSSQLQRTYSDMMFAEVRRFEEIFRESQQQDSQQQQQQSQQQQKQGQNQTDQLIQLQREIILATWNVLRSVDTKSTSNEVADDIKVLAESQRAAIEQLAEVKEQAGDDPSLSQIVRTVEQSMQKAATVLEEAVSSSETPRDRLSSALFAEQTAYQSLLKLRAKEHEVQQQQGQGQGQGQGQQNSASQQQLQQLELSNDRNRYESERQAQQQQEQSEQQREQLQVLNRLKELARRQEMLNERLKQLQSELRTAETEEEKEEIERELKRLREEQREMLRDVDELRERMDQAPDQQQQQNQDLREQVEQARSNVQQASRAMDAGQLAEAISEGTRAERQFEQLQEEFRNRTSSAFEETMRDLRQQARDLTERQEEIAREIAGESGNESDNSQPSLRSTRDRDGLQQKVAEQRDQLNHVLEQTKEIIQQAEESEPLLSRRLYETVRQMRDVKPEEALEATEFLVGRGLWNQSGEAERIA